MLRIRYPQYAPPGGQWFFLVPETQVLVVSPTSLVECEREVVRHMVQHKVSVPPNLRHLIENYMCQRLPEGLCDGEGTRLPGSLSPTYFDVLRELERLRPQAFSEPHVAEARAKVCRDCEMNDLTLCTSCNNLQRQTLTRVHDRTVSLMPYLGVCRIFKVPNYGLVWMQKPWPVSGLPGPCWAVEAK